MAATQDVPKSTEQSSTPQSLTEQTHTISYTLPPDKLAKSKALYDLDNRLRLIDTVYGFAVLLGILYFGVAARYRGWAEKASRHRFVQAFLFVPLLLLTITALNLPLSIYSHHISLQYGFSVQGWGSWFADLLKGEVINLVLFSFVLWLMIRRIIKSPRRWWFSFWLVAVPVLLFVVLIAPVAIDPLFYNFTPLEK